MAASTIFRRAGLLRPPEAATVLNVDLPMMIRQVTHAASGSLYGLLETQPADVTK